MPKFKIMLSALLLLAVQAVMAQGQRISGTITDQFGPVMMANVVELDANNRIVTAAVTDMNGNFSMAVKNAKNKLRVSYVGYKTVTMPIGNRTKFNVPMTSQTTVKEVTVTSRRRTNSGGLSIPKREVSVAQQTMDMSEVEGLAFTSADEALQGKIAGLDIVAGSGNLGAGTQMRLRGVTSISGNKNPLIVVDDQIFDAPDFDAENATEEDYASLLSVNVDDIANISVLKDAASTAMWGSRGANGVIEIKTKRGARGKTKVAFSYKFSGYFQPKGYKLLNGDDYTMLLKEELYNPRQQSGATTNINEINYNKSWADYENWNNNTDWVDAVSQFGQGHDFAFNISGGGQKARFRISTSYLHQKGTIIKQTLNRFTSRLALDYDVSDRIRFITTFAFTYTNNNKNYSDLLGIAQQLAPNMSIYRQDANGKDTDEFYIMNPSEGVRNPSSKELNDVYKLGNPVAIANLAWSKENVYRVNPDFAVQYELLGIEEGKSRLTYKGDVYFDIYANSKPSYSPAEILKADWNNGNYNRAYGLESNSMGFTFKNDLTFTPYFKNEDWTSTMRFRYEMYTGTSSQQYMTDRRVPTGLDIPTLGTDMDPDGKYTSSSTGESRSQSWSYTGHFSYKSRYVLGVGIRADGNSKFGPKNKWAYFPNFSARWNIIDEPFMKPLTKVVSMLAFRPSWGVTGNAPSSESLFYEAYRTGGNYGSGSGVQTAYLERLKLDDLKWETTTSYNLGFNLGLFDDKIEAEFEYYYKTTEDLLMQNISIPSTSGYATLAYSNVGKMTNQGWELNVNFNNIVKIGKFSASANFNVSQNYNEIAEMDESVLNSLNNSSDNMWKADNGLFMSRIQVGNPLASIYGYRYKGVYQYSYDYLLNVQKEQQAINPDFNLEDWINNSFFAENKTAPVVRDANGKVVMNADGTPKRIVFDNAGRNYQFRGGDAIYEDINNDGEINQLDVVYLGNSLPKVNGGFGFTFKYDRFTLRTSFNYRFGCKVVNTARMNLESMHTTKNQTASVNYRWRKDGDVTPIPRALYGGTAAFNWLGSDRYVENGSFVRFQYVNLTYDLPNKIAKKFGLTSLKINASGNNLFCWTKYSGVDPEVSTKGWSFANDKSKTPRSKYFTVGLNLAF
ncbi:SusC/RagA family TonB-linked outer membrane protein [Xylanibacter muris]|uniref:SusC/RagA family TonB-linked outer membrane protein n=1 Tax=Xylanibacter muris TaxID=2736290 RepID=A0ABX2ALC3_9BACT|nr:SusC/RagA family TonB-linked outer membrane protein [Xylanibacter muris]NPD91998.1 SusC/RagA family TonB-linked outer membrane protein [Xylanibacter muris]